MNIRKVGIVFLVLLLSLSVACSNSNESNAGSNAGNTTSQKESATTPERVFNVAVPVNENDHYDRGVKKFKSELEKLTNGRLTIKAHYNNALGGERESVEGMSIGTIDLGISSTGPIGGFVEELYMFDLPYLFDSREHAYAVLDGDIGDELADKILEKTNVLVLGWFENGFRNETNSVRAVNTPADLVGIKHRTQESEVQIDTWKAFGANAMPMAWPEVFTGLQQGVIDSQENPNVVIRDYRFYEVQKYLNLTKHVFHPAAFMMSKSVFDTLSPEDQEAVLKAGEAATVQQRIETQQMDAEVIKELEGYGMIVTEPNLELFRVAAEPVYKKWAPIIGEELINNVKNYKY